MHAPGRTSFQRLHLRRNPFGELTGSERAAIARVDLGDHAEFLASPRRALQLWADHGRGKSTMLLALHRRALPDAPYTQLHAGDPIPPLTGAPVQFVDSVENLHRRSRRALFDAATSLALTTHRDLGRELRRAGYEVRTLRVGVRSLREIEAIVADRVEAARTGRASPPGVPRERLAELHRRFGDDLRGIEHELYLDYERLREAVSPSRAPRHGMRIGALRTGWRTL